jgi:hypothetical protein
VAASSRPPAGLGLDRPEHGGTLDRIGLEAAGICTGTRARCDSCTGPHAVQPLRHVFIRAGIGRTDTSVKDGVRTCRIGKTGMAPIQTAKSNIGAMPHTVLSTNAGTVSHSLPASSTSGARRDGRKPSAFLSVCSLPHSSAHLQLLRSRPDLLRRRLCPSRPARGAARGPTALPNEPPWSRCPTRCVPIAIGRGKRM